MQCSRQIRKSARKCVQKKVVNTHFFGTAILIPGMRFSGKNNQTGEEEMFQVISVPLNNPECSMVKRIK